MNVRVRTLRLLTTAAASAMAFVLLGASPAAAHYVYEEAFTFRSNDLCVYERSEISHGDGGGYARVDVYSSTVLATPPASFPCAWGLERPSGYISAKIQTMAWNGFNWYLCDETNWVYNDTTTTELAIQARMVGGSPYCGPGYYGTMGAGYVWNNAWYGGTIWSGSHYLPDASFSATEAPADFPEAGDVVGVLDASGAAVLDADGEPVTVVVGEAPDSAPGTVAGESGTTVVTEDGDVVIEVARHPVAESLTR